MSEHNQQKASCMLLGISGKQMLVPRNMIAEVVRHSFINFRRDEIRGINSFEWRGCQVPHVESNVVGSENASAIDDEARVVIFYGLRDSRKMPFYGMTVNRSPQLLQVGDEDMEEIAPESSHPGELMQVRIKDVNAFIPKVDHIENSLLKLLS
jgi:hypothetical protein